MSFMMMHPTKKVLPNATVAAIKSTIANAADAGIG